MAIDKFEGEYRWLSNFWEYPFPSIEHFYQAAKTTDPIKMIRILTAKDAAAAKKAGKTAKLREDWATIKFDIMRELVSIKFKNPELRAKLIATGDQELIEGNWWGDTIWGVCKGVGENHLGKILMVERAKWL